MIWYFEKNVENRNLNFYFPKLETFNGYSLKDQSKLYVQNLEILLIKNGKIVKFKSFLDKKINKEQVKFLNIHFDSNYFSS